MNRDPFLAVLRDFILIPLPLAALSVAFFVGGVPEGGIFMLIATLAALWFIRPRRRVSPPQPDLEPGPPLQSGIPEQPPGSGAEPPP